MKKKYKISLLLATTATVVTPLVMSGATTVVTNTNTLTTKHNLSSVQQDKVIFKSNIPGVKFTGKTVINVEPGSLFATINKPTVTLDGYDFVGWYKEQTYETKWENTDKIDGPKTGGLTIYIYPKFIASNVDYSFNISGKDYAVVNPEALYNNPAPAVGIILKPIDGSAGYLRKMPTDFTTNMPITIGKNVGKINDGFLANRFTNFNSKIIFAEGSRCSVIGDKFCSGMTSFNQTLLIPNDVVRIGLYFLSGCKSFNKDITIPSTVIWVGSAFMFNCDAMTSTITINCSTDAFTGSANTCATQDSTAACYQTGMTIKGDYASSFIGKFPAETSGEKFRKLNGGTSFAECSWSYINEACTAYEASAQDAAAETAFCSKFTYVTVEKWDSEGKKWDQEVITNPTTLEQFVGAVRTVQVNGLDHVVRVVGYKHDQIASGQSHAGKFTALTFEFKNVISDSSGFGLATLWNDYDDSDTSNYDYLNSTVRYNLTHKGTPRGYQYWFQKGATTHSEDPCCWDGTQSKSVLDMISDSTKGTPALANALKEVSKEVGVHPADAWIKQSYSDKLFLPTYREITASGTYASAQEGQTYKFYGGTNGDDISSRMRKQVNSQEVYSAYTNIADSDKIIEGSVKNNAGRNSVVGWTGGARSWLCSPYVTYNGQVLVNFEGSIIFDITTAQAQSVAPMFCI